MSSSPASTPSQPHQLTTVTSLWAPHRTVDVDAYAANPLLDDLRQVLATDVANAEQRGPAPTLFPSGDLPAFTTSGADPAVLAQLPWQARHAAAAAHTPELVEILEDCAPGPEAIANAIAHDSPGRAQYIARVDAWLRQAQARTAWSP